MRVCRVAVVSSNLASCRSASRDQAAWRQSPLSSGLTTLSPQDGRERGEKLHRCTVRDRQERSCTEKAMSVSSVESSPPRSACVPVRHGSVVLLRSIPRRVVC